MAKTNAMPKDDRDTGNAVNISDRAIDNLEFIRETMERSTSFTAVPGYGGILMGVTAVVAAYIAGMQVLLRDSLVTWLVEACLAFAIGLLAMWQKSKIGGQSLVSAPAKKFAMSFAPPLTVGFVITLGLLLNQQYYIMAPVCMLCYGAAVVCGGAFSVRIVPVMGWCFMAIGAAAFALPSNYGNLMMAASFGLLHIVFGAIIARKYGG
ncbi:MAG: hypothetical protein ACKVQJ_09745 [Pyrinomonadaceae bacterium]